MLGFAVVVVSCYELAGMCDRSVVLKIGECWPGRLDSIVANPGKMCVGTSKS